MLYERVNDHPVLASQNYASSYEHPLVENPDNEWTWMEFFGTGVPIETHPLNGKANMYELQTDTMNPDKVGHHLEALLMNPIGLYILTQ